MSEPNTATENSKLAVTLSVGELRELVRGEIQEALGRNGNGPLLTPEELAQQLKVPLSWVYESSRQRKIPTHRMGRYIRFSLVEVIASQQTKN